MNTIRCLEESGEYSSHSKKTHFHQIQFCIGKIILWVLKATYWKPREIWPLHHKKTKMKNYNQKKLSKWNILIFPSLSTSLMLIYLCALRVLIPWIQLFLVKHRISFDVRNAESSKVTLPLNIMTRQKSEQETHFWTLPYKGLPSQRETAGHCSAHWCFCTLLKDLFRKVAITKEKHSFGYKESWPFLLTCSPHSLITFSTFWKAKRV